MQCTYIFYSLCLYQMTMQSSVGLRKSLSHLIAFKPWLRKKSAKADPIRVVSRPGLLHKLNNLGSSNTVYLVQYCFIIDVLHIISYSVSQLYTGQIITCFLNILSLRQLPTSIRKNLMHPHQCTTLQLGLQRERERIPRKVSAGYSKIGI